MRHATYEKIPIKSHLGISISFLTVPGGYHPLHWHEETEILYPLNGNVSINIEGRKTDLPRKHIMVVNSGQVHSTFCHDTPSMFVCIHLSLLSLKDYIDNADDYVIDCRPDRIKDEEFPAYLDICRKAEELVRLYMSEHPFFDMESEGLILQMLAGLLKNFSYKKFPDTVSSLLAGTQRVRDIISFVNESYTENISLTSAAEHFGLSREYFCRLFKKDMGMTFLEYLNEVRITHAYYDLVHTDDPISEIMERNGFTNQKYFNQTFKRIYSCTPSDARRAKHSQSS